jgi:uridylate kinase
MKKEVIVISLGGSLIIPDKVDYKFLEKFKKVIKKNTSKHKFVINCGGGSIARKYISAIRETGGNIKLQSLSGIATTRMNARFMTYFFGQEPTKGIPHKIKTIKKLLKKQDIVFCGALKYEPNQTSDSTSAKIAKFFKTKFINLTNVQGLYTADPRKNKNAKFIPQISYKDFDKLANKSKYKPGQHFVLDQTASKIIKENNIPTFILGQNLKQLDNFLKNKKFKGTVIDG